MYIYIMEQEIMEQNLTDLEIRKMIMAERRRKMRRRRITAAIIAVLITAGVGLLAGKGIGVLVFNKILYPEATAFAADVPVVRIALDERGNQGGEKFWSWYGFDYRVSWCACFTSWCEDQVGNIEAGKAPRYAMVADGANWFKATEQWRDAGEVPSPGDHVFFDWENDGELDHVGIVTGVTDELVFTIEGNSNDFCRQKRYMINDPIIYGYGRTD